MVLHNFLSNLFKIITTNSKRFMRNLGIIPQKKSMMHIPKKGKRSQSNTLPDNYQNQSPKTKSKRLLHPLFQPHWAIPLTDRNDPKDNAGRFWKASFVNEVIFGLRSISVQGSLIFLFCKINEHPPIYGSSDLLPSCKNKWTSKLVSPFLLYKLNSPSLDISYLSASYNFM